MKPRKRITGWTIVPDASLSNHIWTSRDEAERQKAAYFPEREYHVYRITLVRQPKRRAKRGGR